MSEKLNLAVIGAGPGGYVSAIKAAQLGMKVAIVENRSVGGTCLNRGCIPTKALIHATGTYNELRNSEKLGIHADNIRIDVDEMFDYKDRTVGQLRSGVETLLKANGVELIYGRATVSGPGRVEVTAVGAGNPAENSAENSDGVEKIILETEKILIATGSVPMVPPIPGADLEGVIVSDDVLSDPKYCSDSMIIIGGGVIGCEFALILNAVGCDVTVLEAMPRLLPNMDKEISQNLRMIMKKRGIEVVNSAMVEKIEKAGNGLACTYTAKDKVFGVAADHIMIAIGRKANVEEIFSGATSGNVEEACEKAPAVPAMERGRIVTDDSFETSIPGIFAIGDIVNGPQLAHVASAQGVFAVEKMAGCKPLQDLDVVPACVYTDPEIACVGMSEEAAVEAGFAVKTGKFVTTSNPKSVIEGLERGFVKLVFDGETDVILGAQLMCGRATDMIGELATAVANKLTAGQLMSSIKAHPTFGEAVGEAAEDYLGGSVHAMPRKRL